MNDHVPVTCAGSRVCAPVPLTDRPPADTRTLGLVINVVTSILVNAGTFVGGFPMHVSVYSRGEVLRASKKPVFRSGGQGALVDREFLIRYMSIYVVTHFELPDHVTA